MSWFKRALLWIGGLLIVLVIAAYLLAAARTTMDIDLARLVERTRSDREIVGGRYSTACYISDSWPSLLYLAFKYRKDPKAALLANTNLGGENAHRGAVLGGIVSLSCDSAVDAWFEQLVDYQAIQSEIASVVSRMPGAPPSGP